MTKISEDLKELLIEKYSNTICKEYSINKENIKTLEVNIVFDGFIKLN